MLTDARTNLRLVTGAGIVIHNELNFAFDASPQLRQRAASLLTTCKLGAAERASAENPSVALALPER